MKKAALISYFNDIDMLELQFNSGQMDSYDKIYIFDGPFTFTKSIDFVKTLAPRLSDTEVGKRILNNPRVSYVYKEWADEKTKRVEAYNAINEDIIVLHDSDEFYSYLDNAYNSFINSDKDVGGFLCQNLYMNGLYASNIFYSKNNLNEMPIKNFMFKRKNIDAEEHLNYLWLVGINQSEPDFTKQMDKPIASGYHFTGMRSERGSRQKFIFYTSLYEQSNPNAQSLINTFSRLVKENIFPPDVALDTFLHSIPDFGGCPNPEKKLIIKNRIKIADLEPVMKEVLLRINSYQTKTFFLIKNVNYFIFLPKNEHKHSIKLSGGESFKCEVFDVILDSELKSRGIIKVDSSDINIQFSEITTSPGLLLKVFQDFSEISPLEINLTLE